MEYLGPATPTLFVLDGDRPKERRWVSVMQVIWRAHLSEVHTDPPKDSKSVWLVRHVPPSDMALHPDNIQGYNNEIQIAGSDAAIGHNPGINEAEPIASKADKAFRGKIASQTGPLTRGHRTRRQTAQLTTAARQRRNGRARQPKKKKRRPLWPLG